MSVAERLEQVLVPLKLLYVGRTIFSELVIHNQHRLDLNNVVVITEELHNEFHKIYGKGENTLEQFKEFYKDKTGKDFKIN